MHPTALILHFRSISEPPPYEERVLFLCIPAKPLDKKWKRPLPPTHTLRVGYLRSTTKTGQNFELDETSAEQDGYELRKLSIPIAWAPLVDIAALSAYFSPLPAPPISVVDDDEDDEPEADEDD